MEFKFGRASRLIRKSEFNAVFGGRNIRVSDGCFTILAVSQADADVTDSGDARETPGARLGLAISKKRAKRAVDRNRIKRVIRESFRTNVKTVRGFDVVVMNRDAAVSTSNSDLAGSLERLWQKLVVKARSGSAHSHERGRSRKPHGDRRERQPQARSEIGAQSAGTVRSGSSKNP